MKYALALSAPLFLSCAAAPQLNNPVPEVFIEPSKTTIKRGKMSTEISQDIPLEKIVHHVLQALEDSAGVKGAILYAGNNYQFDFGLDTRTYCEIGLTDPVMGQHLFFEFRNFERNDKGTDFTSITIMDWAPYGSIDSLQIYKRIDNPAHEPQFSMLDMFTPFPTVQELYELMLRETYLELETLRTEGKTFEEWNASAEKADVRKKVGKAYLHFERDLKVQTPIPWIEAQLLSPCK